MAVSPREKRKLTYEEFINFPDEDGLWSELIDGEVWVVALPRARHQSIVLRLAGIFDAHLREHGGGKIFLPVNVHLADDQVFGPDLTFVYEWGDDPVAYHGPPPLVIEVVSDARRDRIKRERYARYGVPEYWAVLPEAEQVQILRLDGDEYGQPTIHEVPGSVSPRVLPALAVDLGELFAD
jgi:Uma2 family endonuclease